MPPKQQEKKALVKADKMTQGEKKKLKNENKAKANPEKAAAKKAKNDEKRERRYVLHTRERRSLYTSDAQSLTQYLLFLRCSKESGSVKKLG